MLITLKSDKITGFNHEIKECVECYFDLNIDKKAYAQLNVIKSREFITSRNSEG